MSLETVNHWLQDIVDTASKYDLAAHMNLISKNVSLTGIPGYEALGFKDWFAQCEHEFADKILKSIRYGTPKIVVATPDRIMFRVFETVEGTDGSVNAQGVEILIELEADQQWRLVQERVLNEEETAFHELA